MGAMEAMLDNDTVKQRLADNIRHFMMLRHLTQRDLAKKAGETDMFLSHVLRMERLPNVASISRIAESLDVSVDQLLADPPKNFPRSA